MGGQQIHPVAASGRNYVCARCSAAIPEGAHVHHGEDGTELTWVRAVNADGELLHECGTASDG